MCTCVCKCTNHGSHEEVGGQLLRVGALLVSSWALTQAVRLGGKRLSPPHTILPAPALWLTHSSSWPWGAAIPSRDGYYRRTQIINTEPEDTWEININMEEQRRPWSPVVRGEIH